MDSVSPINQKYIAAQSTRQVEKPIEQKPTEKKINKKAVVCSITAAAGIIALAGALIYKAKTGKTKGTGEGGEKIVENIRQFLNKDNQLVEGVTLNKGRAINADNTMFSGIMNTVNKKGEQITLEYQDGFIVSSKRNGKLFKKFENIGNLTREQGVQITQYDKGGKKLQTLITNYDNGKVKRIFKSSIGLGDNWMADTATEFNPNGKISAKAQFIGASTLKQAQIYDDNGKLIREIGSPKELKVSGFNSYDYAEKLYDENGKLTTIKGGSNYYDTDKLDDFRTMMLSERELPKPKKVAYYDADGNISQAVSIRPGHKDQYIDILNKDGSYLQVLHEGISQNKDNSYFVTIQGEFQDSCSPLFNWNVHDGKIRLASQTARSYSKEELREVATATTNRLEEAYKIIQKEDMPYRVGKDGEFTHINIPTVIQQMRDFISSY